MKKKRKKETWTRDKRKYYIERISGKHVIKNRGSLQKK